MMGKILLELEPEERKRRIRNFYVQLLAAIILLVVSFFLVHHDKITLHPNVSLNNLPAKGEYVLRYQSLLLFWMVLNVILTIAARWRYHAVNPLFEETERRVVRMKNILTNSLESIFISVMSQLIFACFADSATILKFIPYINYVMFIGRVTFLLGYPMDRAFGFHLTIWPNMILASYNLYKFGTFLLN